MIEFYNAIVNSDIPFLRNALITGVLASLAFGIIGSFVVVKRISYISGAISHSVLGGIGLGLFLQIKLGIAWFDPMLGAAVFAILSAMTIGIVTLKGHQREDSVIGAIWAIGMAMGLLFLAKTPGYTDPMSYLFGNILLISQNDILLTILLDIVLIGFVIFFYNRFLAISFDEEFARLRGIHVDFLYLLLLCLTALTIVLMVRIVGIVMVIALLTLPAAIANVFSKHLWQMMIIATLFSMTFIVIGLMISYIFNLPSGPAIITISGFVYLIISVKSNFAPKTDT